MFSLILVANDLKPYFLIVVDDKFIYRHEPGLIDYTKSPIHESPNNAITGKAHLSIDNVLYVAYINWNVVNRSGCSRSSRYFVYG